MNNRQLIIIILVSLLTLPFLVSAYHLLQPLPTEIGVYEELEEGYELSQYLEWLFMFALASAAFLAVLQITIGGIQMIFGGASETARTNAKKRISDAIWGLVLALGSVLILTTVSTQFKDMTLDIPEITVEVTETGTTPPESGIYHCFITYENVLGIENTSEVSSDFSSQDDCNSYCKDAPCGGTGSLCTKTGWECNLI